MHSPHRRGLRRVRSVVSNRACAHPSGVGCERPAPPLQPAARRVGARLAAPARASLAGPAGGRDGRETLPAYDPSCYLCPGNARANGERNPAYATTFAFDNDFPALAAARGGAGDRAGGGCWRAARDRALPRAVLLAAPRPHARRMDAPAVRRVVDAWAEEVAALGARDRASRYVQVFENKGAMMGCSNPHPHGQVWATGHVPTLAGAQARDAARLPRARTGATCSATTSSRSCARGERLVFDNEHWVALVPCWAVWPFETMLVPRAARRVARRAHAAPSATPWRTSLRALHRPLRQPLPHARSPTRWAATPRPARRRASRTGACTRVLPAAAALGDGAQVPGRLRADGGAAARPHPRGGGRAAARAAGRALPQEAP